MDAIIKILVVDRQSQQAQWIDRLLAQAGRADYQLSWCGDIDAAQALILSGQYDLVLLDYLWPAGQGRDLLRAARSQGCQLPILVMTEQMEADVDREAICIGASDYLVKAEFEAQTLERSIRYAVERKSAQARLTRLAHYDSLTSIPNRVLFRDRLEHAISQAERHQSSFALMYIDLKGFKQINDRYGHDVGDELIRACAMRLQANKRRSDSVARVGGDEFTLLLEQTESSVDIAHIAEKIIEVVSQPYPLDRQSVVIGCSIGIAVYPEAGSDVEILQRHADMAMYQAKQEGSNNYHFFSEVMQLEAKRQLQLETELRRAMSHNEFELYYQPRIDVQTGEIVCLEVLLRWRHPRRGLLASAEFIALAESTGLIVPLGYWVMRRACLDLQRMISEGLEPRRLAINLSPRQFADDQLVERVVEILCETGTDGQLLELEFSERTLAEQMDRVRFCVDALVHLGLHFALDNFGTGHSSLPQLQRLPLATVKIDGGFIRNTIVCREGARLTDALIAVAHKLGRQVVAEGVESLEQVRVLRDMGCDLMQGYYLHPPVGYADICRELGQGAVPRSRSLALTS